MQFPGITGGSRYVCIVLVVSDLSNAVTEVLTVEENDVLIIICAIINIITCAIISETNKSETAKI